MININKIEKENRETIKLLIKKGALITCKGNISQWLFSYESNNNIFVKCLNPYKKNRTTGGSSGGDFGLVSLGLINSSIGSVIKGSTRIPSFFCGVVGFKPTTGRISGEMMADYFNRHEFTKKLEPVIGIIQPTIGPITKTVRYCEELMKVLCETAEFDKDIPLLDWKDKVVVKRVRIMKEIKKLPISVSQKRAMKLAENSLRKKDIDIVEIRKVIW